MEDKILQYFKDNPGDDAADCAQNLGLNLLKVGAICSKLLKEKKIKAMLCANTSTEGTE